MRNERTASLYVKQLRDATVGAQRAWDRGRNESGTSGDTRLISDGSMMLEASDAARAKEYLKVLGGLKQ